MEKILSEIIQHKLIAIVRGIENEKMLSLVQSLKYGGISCVEITFDHASADGIEQTSNSIRMVKNEFGSDVLLGAGTVLTPAQVDIAQQAGASFILSPNTDVQVIKRSKELGLISMPGAFTPSEAVLAWNNGADIVKIFPVSQVGPSYIQSLKGPLAHMRFSAVGGVNEKNAAEFLKAGSCCLGVGGNLVSKKLIDAGDFHKIEQLAREYVQAIANI